MRWKGELSTSSMVMFDALSFLQSAHPYPLASVAMART